MQDRNFDFLDILSILSFMLGYENLLENREQSRQNNVGAANDVQAKFLLQQLGQKFQEQNEVLERIEQRLQRLEDKLK